MRIKINILIMRLTGIFHLGFLAFGHDFMFLILTFPLSPITKVREASPNGIADPLQLTSPRSFMTAGVQRDNLVLQEVTGPAHE